MKPNWKHISRSCSRILRLMSEPWRRLRDRHRLRAHRAKVAAEREKMQATFDRIEQEERERQAEQKRRDRLRLAGMSKREKTLREKWIRRWDGKRI